MVYDGDRLVDVEYSEPAGRLSMRRLVARCRGGGWRCWPAAPRGDDAVAQGGTFEFVSPGGKTDIYYDPPESRGRPGTAAGPELADPAHTVSLDDFAGQVVVINVWGQWCGPCRAEVTQLQQVYDATRAAGVAFLGIDVRDNNREAAQDFVNDRNVTYPSIYDPRDAHPDRVRRQVPHHRHPVHAGAGPPAPGRRGVPAGTARRRICSPWCSGSPPRAGPRSA